MIFMAAIDYDILQQKLASYTGQRSPMHVHALYKYPSKTWGSETWLCFPYYPPFSILPKLHKLLCIFRLERRRRCQNQWYYMYVFRSCLKSICYQGTIGFQGCRFRAFLEGGGFKRFNFSSPPPLNKINNFGLKRRYIAKILRQLQQLAAFIAMGEWIE